MVRAVVAAFCLAASARGVSLGDGWEVEVGGDGALTGRRHGAVGLEALRLSFALGKASGGENRRRGRGSSRSFGPGARSGRGRR